MKTLESFQNPTFKYLKGLSKARNRRKEERFLMEGRPELDLAFETGLIADMLIYCEEYIDINDLKGFASEETEILKVKKALFDDLSYQNVPSNFLAVFPTYNQLLTEFNPLEKTILIERLEKPGNLGAIMRTCDALGVKQIILAESEIDIFNPNVSRNSRGAMFNVKCASVSNDEAWLYIQQNHLELIAAALTNQAVDYQSIPKVHGVIAFGSESQGLSSFWLEKAETLTMIPMNGIGDSLNLSVSVALMVHQLFD